MEFSRLALDSLCSAEHLPSTFGEDTLADLQADIAVLAEDQNEPISEFACTLLGALVTEDAALFVQLGDGAIVYRVASDLPWRLAAPAHRGEFANEAIFTTRGDASRYVQAIHVNESICEFALMSDGVEFLAIRQQDGEPHAEFLEYVAAGLRAVREPGEAHAHSGWIRAFLASDAVNRRVDDDKTLIVATRVRCPVRP